ncbi:MAG TPA: PfaD family polyunsaturated fatty acid/polyketide biosynthesis protein [Candidatus Competibacteraceae bacterium]|nr:PfaD family polyunsaturated fatty acid/polyketide biosynthesis protein [Candidatus Competibacteraceae bacterium]
MSVPIVPEALGSRTFRQQHQVKYAYVAGAMAKGVASPELVIRMGRARLLSYYGSGGQRLEVIAAAITRIRTELQPDQPYGVNLLHNLLMPELEERTVDLLLQQEVREIEAAAYIHPTPALVRYRVNGLYRDAQGAVIAPNRVLGKASRPEVAQQFLAPPPAEIVAALRATGCITAAEAELASCIPLADDLCAEADSGGHTDRAVAYALIPTFLRLRDRAQAEYRYLQPPRIGGAGGLGTPESIAAAFMLGCEFVLTGSINQCTVEAGTSAAVKELLAAADIQDTDLCPAGDMFEIGAKVQVLKKGVLFPVRANKLYEIYRRYDTLEQLDSATRRLLEEKYFERSCEAVWAETRDYYAQAAPAELERAERAPKQKLAMILRWYFVRANRLALSGDPAGRVDYQIHCGPAMGAFNQWVRDTPLADWRNRHVDDIAERLMREAAALLNARLAALQTASQELTS